MQEIAKALTWTFIHSLWQGLLAALFCALVISSTRKATARLRYNLLGIVMILFFAGSVVTFIKQWHVEAKPFAASSVIITDELQLINSSNGLMDNFKVWVNENSNAVLVVWTFFFLFSCLRLVTGLAAVNRLRHYKTYPATTNWKNRLEQLQHMIGIRYPVSLLQSELVKVPMAFGILKPVILLPLGLITHLPPEQVETILLHELAHIRRRDYLVNLLQHMAEAIFFFNPAIRWISSLMRQEREACCDDMVIANCKHKTNYLNALINFQEYSFSRGSSYAMGIGGKRHYLLNRVRRMITNKNKGINFFETIALFAAVLLLSAFSFIMKESEVEPVKPDSYRPAGRHGQVEQPTEEISPVVMSQPKSRSIKKGQIKILNKPDRDTVPVKDTVRNKKNIGDNKSLPTLVDWEQAAKDAEAALQVIIKIKDQIGVKKESIGVIKEKLKIADGQEKEKLLKEIQRQRRELEAQRRDLDLLRAQREYLNGKAKEKQTEETDPGAKTIRNDNKSATISKDPDRWDKSKEWNKSNEPDKSAQWDKSDEWDKSNQINPPPPVKPGSLRVAGTLARKAPPAGPRTGN